MLLPVPIGPARIRFSGAVTHSPRACVWICVALTPLGRWEVKGGERLDLREARLAQPLSDDGLVARQLLGGEHLVELVLVGPVRIAGLARQALEDARDAGQLQRARMRDDELARKRGRTHADTAVSHTS